MNADVSISPLPSAFATATLPARTASTKPGHAEVRIGTQLDRVAEAIVHAPQNYVHLLQSFERLQVNAAVAHRQIAALNQREAEIAREIGMLEVGFVEWSGREQNNARILALRRRKLQQRFAKRHGRTKPAASPGTRGTDPERFPPSRCDSRANNPRPKAPACGRKSPTTRHPARARDPLPASAGTCCPKPLFRGMAARIPGSQKPAPAESVRREATVAGHKDRPESDSTAARAGSIQLPVGSIPPAGSSAESHRDSTAGPSPTDRHRRCR